MASTTTTLPSPFLHLSSLPKPKTPNKLKFPSLLPPPQASLSDPFVLQIAETLEDSTQHLPNPPPPLQKLRDISSQSLLSLSWPSRKDEPFRFTDISLIKNSQILPIPSPPSSSSSSSSFDSLSIDSQFPNLVFIDGHIVPSASSALSHQLLPDGVYVGSVGNIPSDANAIIMQRVLEFVSEFQDGDLFWSLNGIGAPDVTVVYVPAGIRVEEPLHLRFFSLESSDFGSKSMPVSNPRVLVMVEEGGDIGIVEEYVGGGGGGSVSSYENKCYWVNSAVEIVIREGGKVSHCYVQKESSNAAHTKWTVVRQESSSVYKLVEISSGGKLSRHNLHVQQVGPDTVTELSTFHLCLGEQTQDLHSRLVLDHPRGYSQQLHKCIVAHSSGQAVFDGNIRVNRYAQETDAGQLTRTLLLEPKATVNVKPNLQIVADNVKCSHGAAVSNIEKDLLFYFQARGLDLETTRSALVFSFGAEVIQKLPYSSLRQSVESHVQELIGVLNSQQREGDSHS